MARPMNDGDGSSAMARPVSDGDGRDNDDEMGDGLTATGQKAEAPAANKQ